MPIKCFEDLRCYVNIIYFNFSFVRVRFTVMKTEDLHNGKAQ